MSLNIKLGDPNQDSYVSVAWADSYFESKLGATEWDNLTTDKQKENVLKEAARTLEWFNYDEDKYYESQGLSFPLANHEVITGNCATPTTINSFRHDNLKSDTYGEYPANYWKYGSVHIVTGTPLNDVRLIATSNETTGSIVVTENFSTACNATSEFVVFAPIYDSVAQAQCEQALYLLDTLGLKSAMLYADTGAKYTRIGDAAVSYHEGFDSKITFSPIAKRLLSAFINKNLKVGRG